jgi:arylsulfatase A-like enzyme
MEDQKRLKNQVPNVIRYSDAALGEFLDKFMNDPRFKNTVVVVSADHGLNWFSPHGAHTHSVLWEDLVWVPVLLIGNWGHPPATVDEVRQLADIGPTILDRLGIEIPNHFIGQSLLRRFGDRPARAFFGNADSGLTAGIRVGDDKYFYNYMTGLSRFFDMKTDRRESHNLANTPAVKERQEKYQKMLTQLYSENGRLIQENRFWNWKWSLDGRIGFQATQKRPVSRGETR